MKRRMKRAGAFFMAVLMLLSLAWQDGKAAREGVYFTAVNQQLLELNDETMPFWLDHMMYVPETIFEGTELGVQYVYVYNKGLAVLYTPRTDLRFDLINHQVYDKNGMKYEGSAMEKNGHVFFPLDLVCWFFGLSWSLSDTAYAPLIRIKSDDAKLSDQIFIDAASQMMENRYAAYEKLVSGSQQPENGTGETPDSGKEDTTEKDPPKEPQKDPVKDPAEEDLPIHALEGQKTYLILSGHSAEDVRSAMDVLGSTPATFLLTVRQMEDGDLVRAVLGRGHAIALLTQSGSAGEIGEELQRARELVWNASCSLLQLVWCEGEEDLTGMLEERGCVSVTAVLDRRGEPLSAASAVTALMRQVGRCREDVSIYLVYENDCAEGLSRLIGELTTAEYQLSAWRMTA